MPLTRNSKDRDDGNRPKSWRQRMRNALSSPSPQRQPASPRTISQPSNFQINPGYPRVEYHRYPSPLPTRRLPGQHSPQYRPSQLHNGNVIRVIRLENGTQVILPDQDDEEIYYPVYTTTENHERPPSIYSVSSQGSDLGFSSLRISGQRADRRIEDFGRRNEPPPRFGDYESDSENFNEGEVSLLDVDLNERFRYATEEERPRWYRREDGCPHMHGPDDPSYLCATCRRIDFNAILSQEETETVPPLIDFIVLGPLSTIMQKHQCGFCRLVVQIWSVPFMRSAPYNISIEEKRDLFLSKLEEHGEDMYYLYPVRFKSEYGVPAFHLGKNIWDQGRNSMALTGAGTFLPSRDLAIRPMSVAQPDSEVPPVPRFGRFIKPDQIDLDWIKERLALCDERSVRGAMVYSGVLRAIDVQRMCIVELEDDQRYVTLSYVWGKVDQLQLKHHNLSALYAPGGIARQISRIPKTIRDAIMLTHMIGERYLWVDALCIIQDDPKDQNTQILKMGDVYQQSTLTIIACCGNDASYGLPGLEPNTRKVQQVAAVVGHLPMSNMLPWDDIMLASLWSTRAWTMQEKMLSRRKLIITDHVVMWWCWHSSNPEDEHCRHQYWPPGERDQDMIYFNTENDRVPKKRGTLSSFDMYAWLLWDYTKRNLTNERDAAKAFQGAFDALAARLDCVFISGLPDTELEDALLWCPVGSSVRRIDYATRELLFPSWSWLGWKGKVAYPGHTERDFPTSSINSPLQWYSATSPDTFTGEDYRAWDSMVDALNYTDLRNNWKRDENDDWCWVEITNGRITSHMPFQHPVNRGSRRRPFRFVAGYSNEDDPVSQQLEFKTLSARFSLSHTKFRRKENFDYDQRLYQQHILDASGYSAGYIYTPDPEMMSDSQQVQFNGTQEFIVISRASVNPSPLVGTAFLERDIFQSSLSLTMPAAARAGFAGRNRPSSDDTSLDERAYFDNRIYYKTNPWCLFNVLMIERDQDDVAHRIAMGRIHVGAFMTQSPTWKEIRLQ